MDDTATQDPRDDLLAVRCQLGEPGAFDELIGRWHGPLWHYVRRVAGHDDAAKDVLQDVWLRVLRGIVSLREGARLRPWLFGIARRVLMDRMRQKYQEARVVDHHHPGVELAEAAAPAPELPALDTLPEELARLPVVERDVLSLFYLRELSLAEVAEVLAVPLGTVKSRLHRARGLLRAQLEQGVGR